MGVLRGWWLWPTFWESQPHVVLRVTVIAIAHLEPIRRGTRSSVAAADCSRGIRLIRRVVILCEKDSAREMINSTFVQTYSGGLGPLRTSVFSLVPSCRSLATVAWSVSHSFGMDGFRTPTAVSFQD